MSESIVISGDYTASRTILSRLAHGADLLDALTGICTGQGVTAGSLQAIGALSEARVAYYHQETKTYEEIPLPGHWEILSCIGNVSLRDGAPICHAHMILGDARGNTVGGHLVKGCRVFACECTVTVLAGTPLHRGLDEITGLRLWERKE
ncbi:MAG: DUF296 domain-containing protein [Spirochaetes bacterium]|nr:DUF296 domain-containing protein [Spirochaetota bacterium]